MTGRRGDVHYLITAATAVAAIVLPNVRTTFAAVLILATLLILAVIFVPRTRKKPVVFRTRQNRKRAALSQERPTTRSPRRTAGSRCSAAARLSQLALADVGRW